METITSVKNQEIVGALALKERKHQTANGQYLVEGLNIVELALQQQVVVKIFGTKKYLNNFLNEENFVLITDNVANKLTDLKTSQEIFAICTLPTPKLQPGNALLIDGVQDPGNLGTLIRTAIAFGFTNVFCSPQTVSLYNPKVLRAVQGNHFLMNIVYQDLITTINDLKNEGFVIFDTSLSKPGTKNISSTSKKALVLGNEGQGVSDEISQLCDQNLLIPINSKVDSLNVAIAGAILMYELKNENVF